MLHHETVGAIRREVTGENRQNTTNQPVEPVEAVEGPRIRTPENDEEKRKKVENYLRENQAWDESNRVIAAICEVSEGFVRKVKKELEAERQQVEQTLLELAEPTIEPEPEQSQEPEPESAPEVTPEDCQHNKTAWALAALLLLVKTWRH